ncbi:MAG: helix-turn-helix domain-containing protein [Minisyncoccia bacterium]
MDKEEKKFSEVLASELKNKYFDVSKLSQLTDISERFINDFLQGNFKDLPAQPYVRGYIKKISAVLNINEKELWGLFINEAEELKKTGIKDKMPVNRFEYKKFFNYNTIIFILFILLIGFYFLGKIFIFNAPSLTLANLNSDITFATSSSFNIKGQIKNASWFYINDNKFYPDANGYFNVSITLQPGQNYLQFKVSNASKTITINKIINYLTTSTYSSSSLEKAFNNSFSTSTQ